MFKETRKYPMTDLEESLWLPNSSALHNSPPPQPCPRTLPKGYAIGEKNCSGKTTNLSTKVNRD